jgi:hypothetical protein
MTSLDRCHIYSIYAHTLHQCPEGATCRITRWSVLRPCNSQNQKHPHSLSLACTHTILLTTECCKLPCWPTIGWHDVHPLSPDSAHFGSYPLVTTVDEHHAKLPSWPLDNVNRIACRCSTCHFLVTYAAVGRHLIKTLPLGPVPHFKHPGGTSHLIQTVSIIELLLLPKAGWFVLLIMLRLSARPRRRMAHQSGDRCIEHSAKRKATRLQGIFVW